MALQLRSPIFRDFSAKRFVRSQTTQKMKCRARQELSNDVKWTNIPLKIEPAF